MNGKIEVLEYLDGRHYDRKYEGQHIFGDVPFYIDKAKKFGSPILELACGTGRVTIPITKNGFSITGLDLLDSMLVEAKKKSKTEGVNIEWIEGDMTNFNLNRKFNLVIMPAAAFNWILDLEDIEKCLTCVKKHLNDNSRFIFNAFNPNLSILERDPSLTYPNAEYKSHDDDEKIVVRVSNLYDKKTQINKVRYHYSFSGKTIINDLNLRMIFPQELDAILRYNGFKIDAKYGDYEENPFTSQSSFQVIVCHVKEN